MGKIQGVTPKNNYIVKKILLYADNTSLFLNLCPENVGNTHFATLRGQWGIKNECKYSQKT